MRRWIASTLVPSPFLASTIASTSNVPDYASSPVTTFPAALPALKTHNQAFVTDCNMLNTGAFEKAFDFKGDLKVANQSYMYSCVISPSAGKRQHCPAATRMRRSVKFLLSSA